MKLGNIEASVKKAIGALDAVISDGKKAGIYTTKPSKEKSDLIHSMEENTEKVKLKFSSQMDVKDNGPSLSPAQRQLIYQYRNEGGKKRMEKWRKIISDIDEN